MTIIIIPTNIIPMIKLPYAFIALYRSELYWNFLLLAIVLLLSNIAIIIINSTATGTTNTKEGNSDSELLSINSSFSIVSTAFFTPLSIPSS